MPSIGSSEKLIATIACGLTKWERIRVMSASPSTVTDIDVLALGASIITRIQTSLPLPAASRAEVATMPVWPCASLAMTLVTSLTAIELREAVAGRALRGIGAEAATMLARSTGGAAAGAYASALLKFPDTLAVGCGSAGSTALRALMAATWAGVACCGTAGTLSQNPRALMMSAGV